MAFKRLGQIFVEHKYISRDQLENLVEEQKRRPGELIGKLAESLGMITEEQLITSLAEQMGMQAVTLGEITIPPDVLAHVTEPMAQLYRIIPLSFRDGVLTVAMCDPQKLQILDELRNFLGYEVRGVVAAERDVMMALNRYYSTAESVEDIIGDLENDDELKEAIEGATREGAYDLTKVEEAAASAPVRKLLNMVLLLVWAMPIHSGKVEITADDVRRFRELVAEIQI